MKRLKGLDFLRGIAILLILLRHRHISNFTTNMGWIGVDLFFVLSGFLVSKLIIEEYINTNTFKPKTFLIRRGFKIYPLYFFCYLFYFAPLIINNSFSITSFLSDVFFLQNYTSGWGYAFGASWSLAVEEHFYFAIAIFSYFGIRFLKKKNLLSFKTLRNIIISLLITCLFLRITSNLLFPYQDVRHSTMTHLRIDSLLTGVLISLYYHFRFEKIKLLVQKNKLILVILLIIGISWTPFTDPLPSFFVKTIGFSILYLSFSILLLFFLIQEHITTTLNKVISPTIVNFISKIGASSYAIYLIHTFVNDTILMLNANFNLPYNRYLLFIITTSISLAVGIFLTKYVESYFLTKREQYFPKKNI